MTKNFLILSSICLVVGFASFSAKAEEDMTPAGEVLVETTAEMSTEATQEFDQNVDCMEQAMEGEQPSEDCASSSVENNTTTDVEADTMIEIDNGDIVEEYTDTENIE